VSNITSSISGFFSRLLGDVGAVFYISALIIAAFVAVAASRPEMVEQGAQQVLDATATNVGWLYLLATSGFVIFTLSIAFSKFGKLCLGPDGEPPEFSFTSWLAMIFSGGMGVGLVFWGVAEPMMHFNEPPLGIGDPRTAEAAQMGMRYAFFHWGLHQWANFAVVGLAIAYVRFRHNSYGLISETLRPLLGTRVDRGWGKAIDTLAVVSTIFGVATTLGLGVLQINSGLSDLADITYGFTSQLMIIGVVGGLFMISALTPLDKGIRLLSNANMALAALLLLFVLTLGPTAFIFKVMTQTLGEYLGNITEMSLVTTPYSSEHWVEQWTMFYWAWGLSWAPFVGSFIARISRGRTIREFILGVMIVPVVLSMLWFSTFGGSAIYFELYDQVGIADAVATEAPAGLYALLNLLPGGEFLAVETPAGLYALLNLLPGGEFLAIGAILLVAMFVITSADSATFVLGMFTSKGVLNPTRFVRIMWGGLQLLVAAVLLLSGGLYGLRTVSIIAAFPFMLIMVLMTISLYKDLTLEFSRREKKELLLTTRLENLLLRESEHEEERLAKLESHPITPETTEIEGENN